MNRKSFFKKIGVTLAATLSGILTLKAKTEPKINKLANLPQDREILTLHTSLSVSNTGGAIFRITGESTEGLIKRLNLNLIFVIAKHNSEKYNIDLNDEARRLKNLYLK